MRDNNNNIAISLYRCMVELLWMECIDDGERWGSLVVGERERGLNLLSCEKSMCHSRSFVVVGCWMGFGSLVNRGGSRWRWRESNDAIKSLRLACWMGGSILRHRRQREGAGRSH